ncbi:hypothetical protein D3C87_1860450 [compost metagenome]
MRVLKYVSENQARKIAGNSLSKASTFQDQRGRDFVQKGGRIAYLMHMFVFYKTLHSYAP